MIFKKPLAVSEQRQRGMFTAKCLFPRLSNAAQQKAESFVNALRASSMSLKCFVSTVRHFALFYLHQRISCLYLQLSVHIHNSIYHHNYIQCLKFIIVST